MLTHPTLNRLVTLGLTGMAKAFDEQGSSAAQLGVVAGQRVFRRHGEV